MGFTVNKKKLKLNLSTNYSRAKSWGASPSASSWSGMNNLFYSVYGYRPVTEPGVPLTKLLDNEIDESVNTSNDYRFNPIMSLNNEYNKRIASYCRAAIPRAATTTTSSTTRRRATAAPPRRTAPMPPSYATSATHGSTRTR